MNSCLLVLLSLAVVAFSMPQLPFLPPQELPEVSQLDDDCKDIGTNCRNWALNGFCKNCFYTCEQRKQYCGKTCGFCHPGYVCTTCAPATVEEAVQVLEMV